MLDEKALELVLNDAESTEEEKVLARKELGIVVEASGLTRELLEHASKISHASRTSLESVTIHEITSFCGWHDWSPKAQELFEQWREVYFTKTTEGRAEQARMAEYLRKHDFDNLDSGLREWKESEWKESDRLIRALEVIATSPNRGNYHYPETVEQATDFLAEMKRRTGRTCNDTADGPVGNT